MPALPRALLAAAILALTALPAMAEVTVTHAWVRAAPPGAGVMAGYMTLGNNGETEITLTGARSPQFARVEFHRTRQNEHGTTSMVPIRSLTLSPGETQRFSPGGQHLMLVAPQVQPEAGDSVQLVLETKSGEEIELTLPVRRADPGSNNH